ncbi:unnamed protein product [Prunus armeniaca]
MFDPLDRSHVQVAARIEAVSPRLASLQIRNRGKNYVWLDSLIRGILVICDPHPPGVSYKQSWARIPKWNLGQAVKNCKRFRINPTGPAVMLNETPLHDSTTSDSPLDSPMSQDSPIEKELRPIGRKAAKAKKWGNSSSNTSKILEEIARQSAIIIEMEQKRQENEMAIRAEHAKEREYLRKKEMDKTDRETMAMDTSHMSPETKQFWKLERRDVMRRRLFRDDGPSNTNWLNDQNH